MPVIFAFIPERYRLSSPAIWQYETVVSRFPIRHDLHDLLLARLKQSALPTQQQ